MNSLWGSSWWVGLLLAQGRLESMGSGVRGKSAKVAWQELGMGVALLAGVAALCWLAMWWKSTERRRINKPGKLFRELCRAHRLRYSERKLLRRIADWQGLQQPGRLFTEVERFDAKNLNSALNDHAQKIAALRNKLFAAPAAMVKQSVE